MTEEIRITETRLRLTLSDSTGQWTEEYPAPVEQEHKKWAESIVQRFNEHRRQGEFRRSLVTVEVIDSQGEIHSVVGHDWVKEYGRNYKCNTCGVTGKRRRREWPPIRSKPFKSRFFASCDIARKYMPLSEEERVKFRNKILGEERSRRNYERYKGW